jgi:hypothetical protein
MLNLVRIALTRPYTFVVLAVLILIIGPPSAIRTATDIFPQDPILDQRGLHVATVDGDNRVKLKSVRIARDLGQEVEIANGLDRGDRVIESPPDGLADGERVRVVEPQRGRR